MATVGVDGSSLQADSELESVYLVWGLAIARHLVCIHWMNLVNSYNGLAMMRALCIVIGIIIVINNIIIIIIIILSSASSTLFCIK